MKQRIVTQPYVFKTFDIVISIESKDDLAKLLAASFILSNQTPEMFTYCKNSMNSYDPDTCNYKSMLEMSNILADYEQYNKYLEILKEE